MRAFVHGKKENANVKIKIIISLPRADVPTNQPTCHLAPGTYYYYYCYYRAIYIE